MFFMGSTTVLSLVGLLLTGNAQVVMQYASFRGYTRLGETILNKANTDLV